MGRGISLREATTNYFGWAEIYFSVYGIILEEGGGDLRQCVNNLHHICRLWLQSSQRSFARQRAVDYRGAAEILRQNR